MSRIVNVPMLFRLWFSEVSDDDLCIELRIVRGTMARLAKKYALPPRLFSRGAGGRQKKRSVEPSAVGPSRSRPTPTMAGSACFGIDQIGYKRR